MERRRVLALGAVSTQVSAAVTPADAHAGVSDGLCGKSRYPLSAMVVSAMAAGFLIGLGFVFYTTTQLGADGLTYGVAKTLGGLVFSGALFTIMVLGLDLFTSTTMDVLPVAEKKMTAPRLARHWGIVYLANMLGAALLVALLWLSGTMNYHHGEWGAVLTKAALAKLGHTWWEAFGLGIMCNLMVCLAVWVAGYARTVPDKLASVLFVIPLFVSTGFEHSVANMFIIPMALVGTLEGSPELMHALEDTDLGSLTVMNYVGSNLIPVTLGNIVGGAMVAMAMHVLARGRQRPH